MSGDLISRQAAIDVIEERIRANGYSNAGLVSELNRSIGYLMQLPAAQPEILACGQGELVQAGSIMVQAGSSDVISRQAAIDALVKRTHLTWERLKIIYPILDVLEELPSAEPMSDDTISRQAAIEAYGDWYIEEGTAEGFIGTVKQLLEGLPSAERRGRWIAEDNDGSWSSAVCSVCGRRVGLAHYETDFVKHFPYCHCGARMVNE